jgi:hypothetical protein
MKRTVRVYLTYNFKDKAPNIDKLRTFVQDTAKRSGKSERVVIREACERSGVSKSTPRGWFYGKTRRPQDPTIEAFGRALGFQRKWVPYK